MGFSRQEYWSGLPFPSPGDLPDPGIEPGSPALQDGLSHHPPIKHSMLWGRALGGEAQGIHLHFTKDRLGHKAGSELLPKVTQAVSCGTENWNPGGLAQLGTMTQCRHIHWDRG